ncbi:hypothetical protein B0H11DRAFT_2231792 [Mycena galericulata]|nr:hypothetical protein B0H11DRAFT_2231792 [Mycena galericulata]
MQASEAPPSSSELAASDAEDDDDDEIPPLEELEESDDEQDANAVKTLPGGIPTTASPKYFVTREVYANYMRLYHPSVGVDFEKGESYAATDMIFNKLLSVQVDAIVSYDARAKL